MYPVRVIKLGVNIDHVATLRQVRYKTATDPASHEASGSIPEPDPVRAAVEGQDRLLSDICRKLV